MHAVLDATAPRECRDAIAALGYDLILLPPHPALPSPVAAHPDMLLFFADDSILCTESYQRIAACELQQIARITGRPIRTVTGEYGACYPYDILLNAARVGRHLFCRTDVTAPEILAQDIRVVSVRQGYAKCSILPVSDDAIITADPSIAKAARLCGMEVLTVDDTAVELPGYDHGFVGGCASFSPDTGTNRILFCGARSKMPQGLTMQHFCRRHGKELVFVGDFCPRDVGTVFLIE